MAPTKKTNTTKARLGPDKLTAEFTSGTLIIAICVSLFVAMLCVLIGILIGKYQRADVEPSGESRVAVAQSATEETPPARDTEGPAEAARGTAQGTQTSPRIDRRNRRKPPQKPAVHEPLITELPLLPTAPVAAQRPPEKMTRPFQPEPAGKVEVIALPKTEGKTPPAKPALSLRPPPEKPAPAEAKPAPPKPAPLKPTPPDPASPPKVAPAPKPSPVPDPLPAKPAAASGAFGVQVAAFFGENRVAQAEDYEARFEKSMDYEADVMPSDDGKSCRVLVVGFATRTAADAACQALRKKAMFAEAWVRPLP